MAINNITSIASPPELTGIAPAGGSTGASGTRANYSLKLVGDCATHHAAGAGDATYSSLNIAAENPIINHQDINSLKFAFSTLVRDFGRPANAGHVYAPSMTFANLSTNDKIRLEEWKAAERLISAFAPVDSINRGDVIYQFFYNTLVDIYNSVKNNCLCDSDCGCNLVCACNNDCNCHYSDKRLKENIKYHHTMYYGDLKIPFYTFDYIKNSGLPTGSQTGVIAQELLEFGLDEFVTLQSTGFYKVNYKELYKVLKENNENI